MNLGNLMKNHLEKSGNSNSILDNEDLKTRNFLLHDESISYWKSSHTMEREMWVNRDNSKYFNLLIFFLIWKQLYK